MAIGNGPHPDLEGARPTSPLVAIPPHTFFGAPQCDLASFDHEVALLGVPYDQGSLIPYCRVGQSQGPNAVRANPTFYGGNPSTARRTRRSRAPASSAWMTARSTSPA